jgi:predicted ribosomally synthesized peptide with SipW-like signal peptide
MTTYTKPERNDSSKKKILIILLCIVLAGVLIVGTLLAFFSDVLTVNQNLTAGTLDLTGTATFYINGNTTAASTAELACINPGDTIKAVLTVENEGSKSAWIQGSLKLSVKDILDVAIEGDDFKDVFELYEGDDITDPAKKLTVGAGADPDSIAFTDAGDAILDGTIETETVTNAISDVATTMTYTLVFLPEANNDFQGAKVALEYTVKALQYRNNTTVPTTTGWNSAEAFDIPTTPGP